MIPRELLISTESRAPGILVYGGAGMKKTHGICTLPPPVLLLDIGEGGTGSLLPWVRRRRNSDQSDWTEYTQEQRESFVALLHPGVQQTLPIKPRGYVDLIHFDNLRYESYEELVVTLANFDYTHYNSIAVDSLQELSVETQTFAKGKGNEMKLMNEISWSWVGAQERAQQALRKLRNYRDQGVFVYFTGSETISKDYVRNPMEKRERGASAPEPYSVRGTVNLPGQLADGIGHVPDLLFHARLMNNQPTWVTAPEPLPGGDAWWDAKDRYGRLEKYIEPNVRKICDKLYGEEGRKAIYASGSARCTETG